jgi:hypothetical protein
MSDSIHMYKTGRARCRWKDGIRIDLREIGWEEGCGLDLTGSG